MYTGEYVKRSGGWEKIYGGCTHIKQTIYGWRMYIFIFLGIFAIGSTILMVYSAIHDSTEGLYLSIFGAMVSLLIMLVTGFITEPDYQTLA
jgi:hypothetical protein